MRDELIRDIGEKELIKRLSTFMPCNQTKDDCAELTIKKGTILLNTDLMVEYTHFNDEIMQPEEIGWKAATSNFSDLISSGCKDIIGVNIGLVLNPNTNWNWVKNLYKGVNEALSDYGGCILGGDCSKGGRKIISVTAIGTQGDLKLRRNKCKPGEVLITSGVHGLSKLGLLLRQKKIKDHKLMLSPELITDSMNAFCKPKPKYKVLNNLVKSRTTKDKLEIGCTDSSDGLYKAIQDLSTESNCKAIIDYKKVPKRDDWPNEKKWIEYYFFGGEDYELIFSLPIEWADRLLKLDKSLTVIGYLEKGYPSVEIKNCNFKLENKGFSHF